MHKCKKSYNFEVPAFYHYEIEASSEEEAREILETQGGLSIDGELCELDYRDYQQAKLVQQEEDLKLESELIYNDER
jgi:hypothetical protein